REPVAPGIRSPTQRLHNLRRSSTRACPWVSSAFLFCSAQPMPRFVWLKTIALNRKLSSLPARAGSLRAGSVRRSRSAGDIGLHQAVVGDQQDDKKAEVPGGEGIEIAAGPNENNGHE